MSLLLVIGGSWLLAALVALGFVRAASRKETPTPPPDHREDW